jgi:thioredoxin reductase (NADPH)
VIGHRWSLKDHKVRSFLSSNHVPYRWLDIAGERGAEAAEGRQLDPDRLPVVLFADGSALVDPEPAELAKRVGLSTQAAQDFYDMVVVGAGRRGWRPRCMEPAKGCARW